jgi:hypothetical protein
MIVSSLFSVRTAASVAHVSFEYKWLHKQLVQLRDIPVMDGFISSACHIHVHFMQRSSMKYTTLHLPGQGRRYGILLAHYL